jgi:hypothetical protein
MMFVLGDDTREPRITGDWFLKALRVFRGTAPLPKFVSPKNGVGKPKT